MKYILYDIYKKSLFEFSYCQWFTVNWFYCCFSDHENYDHVVNALKNLVKCEDAIEQDVNITQALRNGYFASPNEISKTEEHLLDLAASGICDELFFMTVFKIGDSTCVGRYFQHGDLRGIEDFCKIKLCDEFKLKELILYNTFTQEDVVTENKRKSNLFLSKRKGNFIFVAVTITQFMLIYIYIVNLLFLSF